MNDHLSTIIIIIAPMTTQSRSYPTRIPIKFEGKRGWIVLDQISSLDRKRFVKKLGKIDKEAIAKVKRILQEMLVD